MGAFPDIRAYSSFAVQCLGRAHCRRWIFAALPGRHGTGYSFLWLFGIAVFLSSAQKICAGSLGFSGHYGHLAGHFTAGIYVFQSSLVPRALGIYGSVISLVLGTHARHTNDWAMGRAWFNFRIDDRRIFSERCVFTSATD